MVSPLDIILAKYSPAGQAIEATSRRKVFKINPLTNRIEQRNWFNPSTGILLLTGALLGKMIFDYHRSIYPISLPQISIETLKEKKDTVRHTDLYKDLKEYYCAKPDHTIDDAKGKKLKAFTNVIANMLNKICGEPKPHSIRTLFLAGVQDFAKSLFCPFDSIISDKPPDNKAVFKRAVFNTATMILNGTSAKDALDSHPAFSPKERTYLEPIMKEAEKCWRDE